MQTLYESIPKLFFIVLMAMLMLSCSTKVTYLQALNKNEKRIDDPERRKDARFLADAKSFNLLEMRLAETAITSGYSSVVVDLARQFLEAYKEMNKELETLARKERIVLPTSMSNEHTESLNEVISTGREDFDRDFIKMMQRINDENKEKYLRMATDASDADIRAFSARKLDLLRAHSTSMLEVEKKLMNTY